MSINNPIKCFSGKYKASPFYLIQSNGADQRYVASFQKVQTINDFILHFAATASGKLQLKIRDLDDRDLQKEFLGILTKSELSTLLETFQSLIFHDGYHELMIRIPESGDYIAFDEHGLVFIYSNDDFSAILKKSGLQYRPNEAFIYEFDHFHVRPANAKADLERLVNEWKLETIFE